MLVLFWFFQTWPVTLKIQFLTKWIMAILSKRCKPDNFELQNSLKLWIVKFEWKLQIFIKLLWIFAVFIQTLLYVNLSLNKPLLIFMPYVWQTLMTQFILAIFSVRDYLPLIQKDSVIHMHGLSVYVKEGLPFCTGLMYP